MIAMLPSLFFEHFCGTSSIIEENEKIVGFLIGFLSQKRVEEGYIHIVVVDPQFRQHGLGRSLYVCFSASWDRIQVTPSAASIHPSMPLRSLITQDGIPDRAKYSELDGIEYNPDYGGPGEHHLRCVCMV